MLYIDNTIEMAQRFSRTFWLRKSSTLHNPF